MKLKKRVLIFAYYSFKDPVFQSAVLPYFLNFPEKDKFHFILLTWEQKAHQLSKSEIKPIKEELSRHNITWVRAKWNSGKFKLLKKLYDTGYGMILSSFLIFRYRINLVYSEGFPGAIISHFLCFVTRRKHVVHTFEPHADYMIESGVWSEKSWEAVWLKKMEKIVARHCYLIMTATESYKKVIASWKVDEDKILRVPSCVDLHHFEFSESARTEIRGELGISKNELVITYLGKLGGMYMEEELFAFFNCCEKIEDYKFRYFILTGDDHASVEKLIQKHDTPREKVMLKKLSREEVPKYLSASDIGFCGIRPIPSRRYSSPIKNGEYWACGLPVIMPAGISDDFLLAPKHKLGFVMESLNMESYSEVMLRALENIKRTSESRQDIRKFVLEDRSTAHYQTLFAKKFLQ